MQPERPKPSMDRTGEIAQEERAAVTRGFSPYSGTYTVDPQKQTVTYQSRSAWTRTGMSAFAAELVLTHPGSLGTAGLPSPMQRQPLG